ncbi:hypothetical protein Q9L58_008445 [Maublancomyces gigas]|uniref:Uncharacterized protein n=1 Tax=Discina gigas TaxID=1032678 RepID=A0ABR3GA39_9PEZI
MASLRSVFTLSVCTAPVRNDKTHPVPSVRCPHCLETVTVADLASMLLKDGPARVSVNPGDLVPVENSHAAKKGNLKLHTSGVGFDCVGCLVVDSAASNLLKTLHETHDELQTHCRDLHQLRLASPSPSSSRRGSLESLESSKASSIASLDEPTAAGSVDSGEKSQPRGRAFESGHPLISDLGDLANLSNANFRLLMTLQDKVNKVDSAEKMLRAEREAIEKERALLKKMSAEVEKERVRLMNGGLGWEGYKMDISRTQSALTMMRTRSGGATPDGTWDDMNEVAIFDEEWTEEKEQHLNLLEQKLKKANRQWSDEQEEILEPLERLREGKRLGTKTKKSLIRIERVNSRDDKSEKSPRKKSNDNSGKTSPRSSSGFKNSLSNIRRKSSIGSIVRRDSSPTGTSQTIFKKWFP